MSIQIPITKNGTTTLLTAGKYCPENISVKVNVPQDQYPFLTFYNSIEDVFKDQRNEYGFVGAMYSKDKVYHIYLFDNIDYGSGDGESVPLKISEKCVLHLNGHKLTFTKAGTYLNVTAETTIDGRVPGSEITKCGVSYSGMTGANASAKLVSATGVHLTILGGKYSMSNIASATWVIPIRTESAATTLDMVGCEVSANAIGGTNTSAAQVQSPATFRDCTLTATAENGYLYVVRTNGALSIENTSVNGTSNGASPVSGCQVQGVAGAAAATSISNCDINVKAAAQKVSVCGIVSPKNGTTTINNCIVDADGHADVGTTAYNVCAVEASSGSTVYINGGTYWGAREALVIWGTAYINGGTYNGCQHGGGYLSSTEVKVKNANFNDVAYTGDCGWSGDHNGAVYCGASGVEANVYFDNCFFNAENRGGCGITVKYTTKVYISNSGFGDNLSEDMRVEKGNYIYIGENVDYDKDDVYIADGGVFDTETYAGQSFAW